jgi:hypothetical protein
MEHDRTQQQEPLITIEQLFQIPPEEVARSDKFQQWEYAARIRIADLFSRHPVVTEVLLTHPIRDVFSPFDAVLISAGTQVFLEAKIRKARSTAWSDWTIDETKALALQRLNKPAAVVMFTTDDVALIWSLDQMHPDPWMKEMISSTCAPERGTRVKRCRLFSISDAERHYTNTHA